MKRDSKEWLEHYFEMAKKPSEEYSYRARDATDPDERANAEHWRSYFVMHMFDLQEQLENL